MPERQRGPAHPPSRSGRGPRPGAPQKRRRRKPQPGAPPAKEEIPTAVDLHIRLGLTDELVRLTPEDWFKVLTHWMLAREDIVIRVRRKTMETNIVLRGQESGILTLRKFDPTIKLPPGEVVLTDEIRDQLLKQKGL